MMLFKTIRDRSLVAVLVSLAVIAALIGPTAAQQIALAPGSSSAHVISAATTNSTNLTTSRSIMTGFRAFNTNAATAFLKFYDLATAPTCNSSTVKLTVPLVQNALITDAQLQFWGVVFNAGIGVCITGAIADTDNTAATTGIAVDVYYQLR